jgi:hypothetical protein
MPTVEVVSSSMRRNYALALRHETHILLNMRLSLFDLVMSVSILAVVVGVVWWLLIIDARAKAREQRDVAYWLRQHFNEGGLARTLMARWKRQDRLTDRTEPRGD